VTPISIGTVAAAVGLIDRFIGRQAELQVDCLDMHFKNSPWVAFEITMHHGYGESPGGKHEFALWRSTGVIYAVEADGAIEDDSVESLAAYLERRR
jgi:hypothetical protein